MGGLISAYKFDKEDSAVQFFSSIKSLDIEECLSFYITDYPNILRVSYRHFDDIFGGLLNDVDRYFLFFSNGKTDADLLEIFAILIISCKGSVIWKVKMLFCLFDFDNSESIDKNELSLVISAFTKALSKLASGVPPSVSKLYMIASQIFKEIDRDSSLTLELQEILDWSEKSLEFQELMAHFSHVQSLDLARMKYAQVVKEFEECHLPDFLDSSVKKKLSKQIFCSLSEEEIEDFFRACCIGNVVNRMEYDRIGKNVLAFCVSDYNEHKGLDKFELQNLISLMRGEEVPLVIAEEFMLKYGIDKVERLVFKKYFAIVVEDKRIFREDWD